MAQSGYKVGDIPNPRQRKASDEPVLLPEQPGLGDVARQRQQPQVELDAAPYVPDIGAVYGGVQPDMLPQEGAVPTAALDALMRLLRGQ